MYTGRGDAVVITGAIPIRCSTTQAYTFDELTPKLERLQPAAHHLCAMASHVLLSCRMCRCYGWLVAQMQRNCRKIMTHHGWHDHQLFHQCAMASHVLLSRRIGCRYETFDTAVVIEGFMGCMSAVLLDTLLLWSPHSVISSYWVW